MYNSAYILLWEPLRALYVATQRLSPFPQWPRAFLSYKYNCVYPDVIGVGRGGSKHEQPCYKKNNKHLQQHYLYTYIAPSVQERRNSLEPLFFLHKCFFRHNYALKNSYQRWPTRLNLYVKIMYIETSFVSPEK